MMKVLVKIRKSIGCILMIVGAPVCITTFGGFFVIALLFGPGIDGVVGAPGDYPLASGTAPVSTESTILLFVASFVGAIFVFLGAWLWNPSFMNDLDDKST